MRLAIVTGQQGRKILTGPSCHARLPLSSACGRSLATRYRLACPHAAFSHHLPLRLRPASPPVAHKIYGIPQTINSANYVYFLAYQELFKFRRREEGANMDEDGGSTGSGKGKGKARAGAKGLDEIITGGRRCAPA